MKLVLASNNPGKLREIEALVAPSIELLPQSSLGIAEAEEPHASFVENALAKARHASRLGRLPAIGLNEMAAPANGRDGSARHHRFLVQSPGRDCHIGAFTSQRDGSRRANPARAASDEGDFSR